MHTTCFRTTFLTESRAEGRSIAHHRELQCRHDSDATQISHRGPKKKKILDKIEPIFTHPMLGDSKTCNMRSAASQMRSDTCRMPCVRNQKFCDTHFQIAFFVRKSSVPASPLQLSLDARCCIAKLTPKLSF